MSTWAVVPAIRVRDMAGAIEVDQGKLGFTLERGGPDDDNSALSRGAARIMIDVPANHYSAGYNEAIERRLGSSSPTGLYVEESDLEELYAGLNDSGVEPVDPLADRPRGQAEFTIEDLEGNWRISWKTT